MLPPSLVHRRTTLTSLIRRAPQSWPDWAFPWNLVQAQYRHVGDENELAIYLARAREMAARESAEAREIIEFTQSVRIQVLRQHERLALARLQDRRLREQWIGWDQNHDQQA